MDGVKDLARLRDRPTHGSRMQDKAGRATTIALIIALVLTAVFTLITFKR